MNLQNLHACKYYEEREDKKVQCKLCPHNCIIQNNKIGLCKTRINYKGKLFSLTYNKPSSIAIDPIEKKPLFHFHNSEKILSIGTLGCNFSCKFCQNSDISQIENIEEFEKLKNISPEEIIQIAKNNNLKLIAFTYNEPTIFFEYMLDIAKLAKQNNIECVIVSNGFINPEPLKELCNFISATNIDLKSFDKDFYRKICNGKLEPVLQTLKILKENNIHIEITTLIIDKYNDSPELIKKLANWIKDNLGPKTPLHITRSFPMYKMLDIIPTPITTIENSKVIAEKFLDYVFIGNV